MRALREEVLRRADIVEVVSSYIPLKKRGSNYWALSPFKPERTPSFAVSPSKQIFKCFASGKGGDVIRFVMEMEGLSYGEALRKLAEKYGIPIPSEPVAARQSKERQRYLALYQEATRFYQACLRGSPAEAYLHRRGLNSHTIADFLLGYAPPDGKALTQHLLRLGYPENLLVTYGLSARHEESGRLYDRFRDRVIFPIQDETGEIIAFAGRTLASDTDQPKYLNSPETPFYQKSEVLYGLFQAKAALRKGLPAVVVEGYMDVLSLHQRGLRQAVATCGTALTEAHLARLRRYTREVILLYDSDEAGQAAAERAIFPALKAGFFVRVAQIPAGKDPDEYAQTASPEALEAIIKESVSWPLFLAKRLPDSPSAVQRYQLLQKLAEGLHSLPDYLLRRSYADEIAAHLQIPPEFWDSFTEVAERTRVPEPAQPQRISAERELLRLWLTYPEYIHGGLPLWQILQEELKRFTFTEEAAEALRQALCSWPKNTPPTLPELSESLTPEVQDWAAALLLEKYSLSPHWQTWDDSPLTEDPGLLLESNLNLLHIRQLQRLLRENLAVLSHLSPDDPTYMEHLAIHQFLVRQRTDLAHMLGVILPSKED
ncbi:MAG: DNA primase [Bacteroidia bacterium]|nr:DNA primase [Bacteroidia bacterium]MDW8088911.1 DNA primase [Bacteroidia bacterium]